jgi:Fe-Mn family superoxide dismutase
MHIFLVGGVKMSSYPKWYEQWLKEPILDTIRFHQHYVLQHPHSWTTKEYHTLQQRLQQLEETVISSDLDPNDYYRHLKTLVEIEKDYANVQAENSVPNNYPSAYLNQETVGERARHTPVPIGQHRLPPLPYAYDALEPYIDEQTMRLHHDEHHKKYVDDLNKAENMLQKARVTNQFDLIKHWSRELAFNGAGHYLHTLFWKTMSPHGGGEPSGSLKRDIQRDFGSFHQFKQQFSQAAEKVEGGGWAILVYSPRSHRLEILQVEKHQNLSQWDVLPLLPLDVWEHAYYLKYPNKRKAYIENWWNVVHWKAVQDRYRKAKKLMWKPY